jgi:hypothetical protein
MKLLIMQFPPGFTTHRVKLGSTPTWVPLLISVRAIELQKIKSTEINLFL